MPGAGDVAFSVGGAVVVQWLAIQAPLWVLRLGLGWRLSWPGEEAPAPTNNETQFGLRQLFVWTILFAVTFALARWLLPGEAMSGGVQDVSETLAVLIVISVFSSFLALPIIWATLVRRWIALWLPISIVCCVVLAVAEGMAMRRALGTGVDEEIFWALNAIQFVAATASLLLLRGSGVRLVQISGGRVPAAQSLEATP